MMNESNTLFEYTKDDFLYAVDWTWGDTETLLDRELQSQWKKYLKEGEIITDLGTLESKRLPGKFQFLAQVHAGSIFNRRATENSESMDEPSDQSKSDCSKPKFEKYLIGLKFEDEDPKHFVLINGNPFEYCHSFLLPEFHQCLPHVATARSIEAALQLILLSGSPALRITHSNICATSSVNQLHYHTYYLRHPMPLENIELEHLSGTCHVLTKHAAPAFAFEMEDRDIGELTRSVYKLINYLQIHNIPHNMYITRTASYGASPRVRQTMRDTVRIYVWTMKDVTGNQGSAAFSPDALDVFGHIIVKMEEEYELLTEEKVATFIVGACQETFESLKDKVKKLFAEEKKNPE